MHKAVLRREVNGVRDVAVKVQYPGALQTMLQDLTNIRLSAKFLQVLVRPDSWLSSVCGPSACVSVSVSVRGPTFPSCVSPMSEWREMLHVRSWRGSGRGACALAEQL